MVRTRDFAILLLIISILAIGGGATTIKQKLVATMTSAQTAAVSDADTTDGESYTAEIPTSDDGRLMALNHMREAVAKARAVSPTADASDTPVADEVAADVSMPETPTTTPTDTISVNTCSGYSSAYISWFPQLITQIEREGMRLYIVTDSMTTADGTLTGNEIVRVRIPMRQWPLSTASCISSDVIGIALDGSLIRNNEVATYAIFSADTLVGYALDGFPLYGQSDIATDACGGAMVNGSYRYIVASERNTIINCYSGIPVTID